MATLKTRLVAAARRNLFWLVVLTLLGSAVLVLAVIPAARQRAGLWWHDALQWAGVGHGDATSDQWFWCPMHPQIKRNKPNEVCPICNMALVPLEGDLSPQDLLVLTPQQIQQAGVVTRPIIKRALFREIDTTGRLDYDERLERHLTSWVKGKSRIVKQHVNFEGDTVKKGALLVELYNPELIAAQEEFLIAVKSTFDDTLARLARKKLSYWGMTPEQIDELKERGRAWETVPIHAPISGTVVKRFAREGEYVSEGESLYRLADLSRLWLFADVYEGELPLVKIGQKADVQLRAKPEKTYSAVVAFIDPVVQPMTRTVRVRFNIENEGGELKPGMYARVQLKSTLPELLAVPENAVLWSGRRTVAMVKLGEGRFEPREVRLGRKWLAPVAEAPTTSTKEPFGRKHERYHEVLSGLAPGEEVVTAGAFLVNAESQFQNILTKMLPPESESATLEQVMGEASAKKTRALLSAYYDLSKTLADDALEPVPDKAAAVAKAAQALEEEARQAEMLALADSAGDVHKLARAFRDPAPKDLKEARYRFGKLSRSLIQLLAEHGGKTLFGSELFLFRCGMSKVGYENWLWWSREKLNPYMGQRMLDCGSELKVLAP